LRSRRLVT